MLGAGLALVAIGIVLVILAPFAWLGFPVLVIGAILLAARVVASIRRPAEHR